MHSTKALASAAFLAATMGLTATPAAAQCGKASWYALHSRTASGERMNPAALTAAHKSLPLGSKVEVINKRNGRMVVVRINDRGPYVRGRIIDLSRAAARQLGFVDSGEASVCIAMAD
jgi:rare lipoprotein A